MLLWCRYGLVNEGNIRALTRELLDYLAVSDAEFKPDLTSKICTLIQRFAPDKRWHIDNLVQVGPEEGGGGRRAWQSANRAAGQWQVSRGIT
jgi:hypothetical protein